jgi:hypothetical protein
MLMMRERRREGSGARETMRLMMRGSKLDDMRMMDRRAERLEDPPADRERFPFQIWFEML